MIVWPDDWRRLRPWLLGALGWGILSLVVMLEYMEQDEPKYLTELWFLLSLLWWQLCFAGIFGALRHQEARRLPGLLLVSLLPPLILRVVVSLLA